MAQPMLQVENLSTHYGAICAVNGVSLHVNQGEIVSLIGSNGAGKTSLLMTLCGTPRASGGTVRFEGEDITQQPTHLIMRKGIAVSPEGRRIFSNLTVVENLKMGGFFQDGAAIEEGMEHVFKLFPRLKDRAAQRAGTMSGGEQQMLAIGRALMTNPRLLILDEATEGLAPVIRRDIWAAIRKLKAAGQSILVVDKTLVELLPVADRCFVLEKGVTVFEGAPETLTSNVQDRYLGV